jgi:predicted nucleotidyltransferase
MDFDKLLALLTSLGEQNVEYVLIGGAALNVHGIIRATEDIDIFVRPDRENVERLKSALRALWDDQDIDELNAEDLSGPYPVVRYGPPGEELAIDLVARLGQAFKYEDIEAETVRLEGVQIRVATPAMLYRMKRDTVRPIDRADAVALKQLFEIEDD